MKTKPTEPQFTPIQKRALCGIDNSYTLKQFCTGPKGYVLKVYGDTLINAHAYTHGFGNSFSQQSLYDHIVAVYSRGFARGLFSGTADRRCYENVVDWLLWCETLNNPKRGSIE